MNFVKKQVSKKHNALINILSSFVDSLKKRFRFQARIRVMNSWCSKHPKKMCLYVVGTLLFIMIGNAVLSIYLYKEDETSKVENITAVDPLFNKLQDIQKTKDFQYQQVLNLTQNGRQLRNQLDSLMKLSNKSKTDSIAIVSAYRQIEIIVNTLKQNEN